MKATVVRPHDPGSTSNTNDLEIATFEVSRHQDQQQARPLRRSEGLSMLGSLRFHWPEYLMEAAELALYLFFACAFSTLLWHPASPIHRVITGDISRRAVMGLGMGTAIVAIIRSPWGQQSGGHFNPAITLTYYRLGKVEFWDAGLYTAAQFLGAIGGVAVAILVLRGTPGNAAVRYAVTVPGRYGQGLAFFGELAISFALMITVLFVTNRAKLAPYTAYLIGLMIAAFITFESPLSGMSMNPARTFGSAFHADYWGAIWIYFVAPSLGMLAAAEVFLRLRGGAPPFCAKLDHDNNKRCIFHHGHM